MEKTEENKIIIKDIEELYSILFKEKIFLMFGISAREAEILKMRLVEFKTFKEISKHYNLTNERIRQIYKLSVGRFKYRIESALDSLINQKRIVEENLKLSKEIQFYKQRFDRLNLKEKEVFSPIHNKILNPIFKTPIENLNLSVRAVSSLRSGGIKTIGDIMEHKKEELCLFRNLGKKTQYEIEFLLKEQFGLKLK